MVRAKIFGLAGAAALVSTATLAADLPPPPLLPPPPAPVVVATGGWYLRGDVGMGIQRFSDFRFNELNSNFKWPASWRIDEHSIGDTDTIGFGIGYQWNNWFRFDVTGEHRKSAALHVIGHYATPDFCGPDSMGNSVFCFDRYQAQHSAWVVMANAYLDLGTWWCLTPFIGAGVGTARHQFDSLTDSGFPFGQSPSFAFAALNNSNNSKWTGAWAFHAGVAYNVTNNVKIELAYRYINFGDIDTPNIGCNAFGCNLTRPDLSNSFYTLTKFDAQELRIGLRFLLTPPEPAPVYTPPPPVMRKG